MVVVVLRELYSESHVHTRLEYQNRQMESNKRIDRLTVKALSTKTCFFWHHTRDTKLVVCSDTVFTSCESKCVLKTQREKNKKQNQIAFCSWGLRYLKTHQKLFILQPFNVLKMFFFVLFLFCFCF